MLTTPHPIIYPKSFSIYILAGMGRKLIAVTTSTSSTTITTSKVGYYVNVI